MTLNQAMWIYLIKNGMILERESYYGDLYDYDLSDSLREDILSGKTGIDWGKSGGVKDGYHQQFQGTFFDNSESIEYLKGNLVLNNGKSYHWKMDLDSDWSFCDTVNLVVDLINEDIRL